MVKAPKNSSKNAYLSYFEYTLQNKQTGTFCSFRSFFIILSVCIVSQKRNALWTEINLQTFLFLFTFLYFSFALCVFFYNKIYFVRFLSLGVKISIIKDGAFSIPVHVRTKMNVFNFCLASRPSSTEVTSNT